MKANLAVSVFALRISCAAAAILFGLIAIPTSTLAASCPPAGPVVANAKVDVIYDPADSSMKACVAGSWLVLSGGGGGGGPLDGLTDVTITSPALNDVLLYDGGSWVNSPVTITESDPQVGALTASNWCAANAGGTAIVCNQAAPSGGSSSSGAAGYVQLSGGSGAFASSSTTAGQQLFWDSTNHRLGIATATPSARLTIGNNVASGFLDTYGEYQTLLYDGGTAGTSYGVGVKTGTLVFNSGAGGYSFDGGAGGTRLHIDVTGNVGIGTTSPSGLLDVNTSTGWSGGSGWANNLRLVSSQFPAIRFFSTVGNKTSMIGNLNDGSLRFGVNGTGDGFGSYGMSITASGNVGIGTSTPASTLHVDNGFVTSARYGSTGALVLRSAEGTQTAPSAVSNAAWGLAYISGRGYDGAAYREGASIIMASEGAFSSTSSPANIRFSTVPIGTIAPEERMRILANGNVGIGTTIPTETLDVNGSVKATTYKGLSSNFTRITATISSTSTVAWGYSSYVACPAGYTLINWGLANTFSSGAFSGAGVSYHDCNVSGNSVRAAHFTQVVNANFFTTCFGLCVRD